MNNLKFDIEGYYGERRRLFQDRWALGPTAYAQRWADLNATIYGYELLICRHFRESLPSIFAADEAASD